VEAQHPSETSIIFNHPTRRHIPDETKLYLLHFGSLQGLEWLRRIFRPKRDEVTGKWSKLHDKGLNDLYCPSPDTVRVIKPSRMRRRGHVACMGARKGAYRVLVGRIEKKNHSADPGIDGSIILRWNFRKGDVRAWTGLMWFRIGTDGGLV
jgi:hypothetical protein